MKKVCESNKTDSHAQIEGFSLCHPDVFHQDRDEFIVARATVNARFANSLRLMPGDRVNITGQLSQQELSLGNSEKKLVNHLIVTNIVVIEKAVRKSITIYEQKRGR